MTDIGRNGFAVRQAFFKISRHVIFALVLGMIAVANSAPAMAQYVKCPNNIDLKTFKLSEISRAAASSPAWWCWRTSSAPKR